MACSVMMLSLEATYYLFAQMKQKSLKAYIRHDGAVVKLATDLEGSVAELSLASWTLGPWQSPHQAS